MLSVGIAVDPNDPSNLNKRLKIVYDYKVTMADVIIMVSDHDEEMGLTSPEGSNDHFLGSRQDPDGQTSENSSPNMNISGSRSSRPSCHRTRSESLRSQLQLVETRSNIPIIHGHGTLKPCSYYRQKMFQEDPNNWLNASVLQKSAGQKVIKKINDQHRNLAAAEQRKRSTTNNAYFGSLHFLNNGNDGETQEIEAIQKNILQMKKRPTRLEPLQISRKVST